MDSHTRRSGVGVMVGRGAGGGKGWVEILAVVYLSYLQDDTIIERPDAGVMTRCRLTHQGVVNVAEDFVRRYNFRDI